MATVSFTHGQAIALSKAIPLAVGGSDRPGLAVVRIATHPTESGAVRIDMTDGYKAFRFDVTGAGTIGAGVLLYGRELAKALGDAAKAAGKAGGVSITVDDGAHDAIVTGAGVSITVPTSVVDFPNVDSFMIDTHPTESGACFDPVKIGDVMKTAVAVVGKDGLVNVETINPTKPARFTANGSGMSFTAVLMPCRK